MVIFVKKYFKKLFYSIFLHILSIILKKNIIIMNFFIILTFFESTRYIGSNKMTFEI